MPVADRPDARRTSVSLQAAALKTCHQLHTPIGNAHLPRCVRFLRISAHVVRRPHGRSLIICMITGAGCRNAVHFIRHRFSEIIHRIIHVQLSEQVIRVSVPRSHSPVVPFLMADNDILSHGIQPVFSAEFRKELYRRIQSTPYRLSRPPLVRTDYRSSSGVFHAGGLTHLHTNMSAVPAPTAVPRLVVPGKRLIHLSRIRIYKSVNTDLRLYTIHFFNKYLCGRLGTAHAVQHNSFHINSFSCPVAGIQRHKTLHNFHFSSLLLRTDCMFYSCRHLIAAYQSCCGYVTARDFRFCHHNTIFC